MVKLSFLEGVDSITVLTLRMLFSLPFYLAVIIINAKELKKTKETLSTKDWGTLVFMGVVGYYLASIFDFEGLTYVTAGLERLILFVYPTLVVLLSALFLKKIISKTAYIALGLTYLGVFIVFIDDAVVSQPNVWLGSLFIFGSALTYAIYLIGTGQLTPKFGSINYTALSMIISTIAVFIHYAVVADVGLLFSNSQVLLLCLLMAVFSTVIPSFLISEGIRIIGSSRASIVASVGPVSTIVLAYFFLGESLGGIQLIGTLVVLTGVLIVSLKK